MNTGFQPAAVAEFVKFALELVVLLLIVNEVRALRRHHKALEIHGLQLSSARPLFTTLYTDSNEIMDLAVRATREANEVYALGSLSSLSETEIRYGEDEQAFNKRLTSANQKAVEYVNATRDHILGGRKYCRIMDFRPKQPWSDESLFQVLANVNFFLRLMEFAGSSKIQLNLYHSPEILRGQGDFHFRCSDRQLIIRVGGHGNSHANAAISITDTRVVSEFLRYYQSLANSTSTIRIGRGELLQIRDLLSHRTPNGLEEFLDGLMRPRKQQ